MWLPCRDRSAVVEQFYGQFKSTITCPECGKVSRKFDEFSMMALEVPRVVMVTVVYRIDDATGDHLWLKRPERFAVKVHRSAVCADINAAVSRLTGLPQDRLLLTEIEDSNITRLINTESAASRIRDDAVLVAYEIIPFSRADTAHCVLLQRCFSKSVREPPALFGMPLVLSFNINLKCSQLKELVWKQIRGMTTVP
ncbi:unnamed protein product, partial [Chrysoparadoxa australica]